MQDGVPMPGVKLDVAIEQLDDSQRKLEVEKSKNKLEPTRAHWDLHWSPTTTHVNALGDVQETCIMYLAKDLQKQQIWWDWQISD